MYFVFGRARLNSPQAGSRPVPPRFSYSYRAFKRRFDPNTDPNPRRRTRFVTTLYQLSVIVIAAVVVIVVVLFGLSIPFVGLRDLLGRRIGGAIIRLAREGARQGEAPADAYRDLESALVKDGSMGGSGSEPGTTRLERLAEIHYATERLRRYHPDLKEHLDKIDAALPERNSFIDFRTARGLLEPLRSRFPRA